jgi:alkaline phosphatase D
MNSRSPYGGDYAIFEAIYETRPDAFIWLGDNVYYREPDWTSRTGMIHRWTHDSFHPTLASSARHRPPICHLG